MRRHGVELFHGTDYSVPYMPLRPSVMTLHDLSPWLNPAGSPGASRVRRRTPRLLVMGLATMVITPTETVEVARLSNGSGFRRTAWWRFLLAAGDVFRPSPPTSFDVPYFLFHREFASHARTSRG